MPDWSGGCLIKNRHCLIDQATARLKSGSCLIDKVAARLKSGTAWLSRWLPDQNKAAAWSIRTVVYFKTKLLKIFATICNVGHVTHQNRQTNWLCYVFKTVCPICRTVCPICCELCPICHELKFYLFRPIIFCPNPLGPTGPIFWSPVSNPPEVFWK